MTWEIKVGDTSTFQQRGHDIAGAHAAGILGQDLAVKQGQSGLALGNNPGFKLAVAVTGHLNGDLAVFPLHQS